MRVAVIAFLIVVLGSRAHAHDVRGDVVFLDLGEQVVDVEVQVPVAELELAHHIRSITIADVAGDAQYVELGDFIRTVKSVRREATPHGDVIIYDLRFVPPAGESARSFTLREDIILHEVVNANVYVFVRRDLQAGAFGDSPTLAGALHYQQRSLAIRRDDSMFAAIGAAFHLGLDHIREGTDHLMFLLLLLVAAPAVKRTAKIATAFTIGHSITLALGAVVGTILPARFVESMIAVSILVSAINAWQPRFGGREWWIAGGFGLIHGLAFAGALAGFGFDGHALVLALFGFNLGVEAMQLVAIGLVVPSLIVIARGPFYVHLRRGIAVIGMVASLAWLADRAVGITTPIPHLVERAGHHGLAIAVLFGVVAVASLAMSLTFPKEQRV
ncbi:MAG: HupE/UreJ family protein [Kofleriaceae bacterium]